MSKIGDVECYESGSVYYVPNQEFEQIAKRRFSF